MGLKYRSLKMRKQSKKRIVQLVSLSSLLFLTSCEKYYLSLTDQNINVNSLASVGAGTPDKRQQSPPFGEMIVMDWRIPKDVLQKHPVIDLHVIYGDYTEESFEYTLKKRMGYVTYKDLNEEYASKKGIITFRADIRLEDGTIYREWKHQLWANLITISDDSEPTVTPPATPPPPFTPPASPSVPTVTPPPATPPPFTPPASPQAPTFTPPATPAPSFTPPESPKVPEHSQGQEKTDDDYEEDKSDSNGSSDNYANESKSTSYEDMDEFEDYEQVADDSDEDGDDESSDDGMSSFLENEWIQESSPDIDYGSSEL